ncbi:MAG: ROK family protein [Candidatus Staskawiczbacteria bacterium]|nr:ROK family protein [Candidatus Staskawiczbacteria bacterium]
MSKLVRVIDGGGNGFRSADVIGTKVSNFTQTKKDEIRDADALFRFVANGLTPAHAGIAYAMAGDIKNGVMIKSPQLPWLNGVDLQTGTNRVCRRPVHVDNDMNGAVAGMATLLDNPPFFMGITHSSGIGERIWKDGKILTVSCEGGHVQVDRSPFATLCGCGLRGCVESICGGEAVRRRVIAETEILGITIPKGVHPCAFLDKCAEDGQPWAINIYDMVNSAMGLYLATIQTLLHLPLVVWKGTFAARSLPTMEHEIRCHMRRHLMNPDWEKDMKFIMSPDPEKDSLIGAAALFEQAYPG